MGATRIMLIIFFILNSLFTISTVIHYFRNAASPRIIFILLLSVSLVLINVNWNTLVLEIKPLTIGFNPSSIFRPGNLGVWEFKLYIPVFAFLYWIGLKDKILGRKKEDIEAEEMEQDGPNVTT